MDDKQLREASCESILHEGRINRRPFEINVAGVSVY